MDFDRWMQIGTVLKMNAKNCPDKLGWQDKYRSCTFREWNTHACQVANGLKSLNVDHQERFAVISHNRGEWMDIYAGCAKGGQIIVPVLFRHNQENIEYIVSHSQCKAFIVEEPFVETIDAIREKLDIADNCYIYLGEGPVPDGYIGYEQWLSQSDDREPKPSASSGDIWTFMFTSGTTGRPKAVVRTHESYMSEYYLDIANMGVRPTDKCMLVMPMSHVNSVFYAFPYTLVGAPVFVYNRRSFDALDLLKVIEEYQITFTSLVPTHYRKMLDLPDSVLNEIDVSSIKQMLISSAPATESLKKEIMAYFGNAELWEAYGTTEGGLVTLLRPEDQFRKLGSVGKEIFGTDRIKLLDEEGNPVAEGEPGEMWYRTPMLFKEYWGEPEKTISAFRSGWSSAGDIARRDEEGFYYLVDRKENMIITGGENVYPKEVENALATHPAVKDKAVVGVLDDIWGEAILAVVVLKEGYCDCEQLKNNIIEHCKKQIPSFMKPKYVTFISAEEMPRNVTGKILHKVLRERYKGIGTL